MNSKSFDNDHSLLEQIKKNQSFEFVKLYKSAAESKVEPTKVAKKKMKLHKKILLELEMLKRSRLPSKNKKKSNEASDLSSTEIVEHVSSKTPKGLTKNSLSSTPKNKGKHLDNSVKSIMKNKSSDTESVLNEASVSTLNNKSKKRNKSVSFMLEDVEELVVKKSKSSNSTKEQKKQEKEIKNKEELANTNAIKKNSRQSKENENFNQSLRFSKKAKTKTDIVVREPTIDAPNIEESTSNMKKKKKKNKKFKSESEKDVDGMTEYDIATKEKSFENGLKRKKNKTKHIQDSNTDAEGEPAIKTRKKDLQPEIIAEGIENLNIGDNTHTLTNLLDEMTVVDKYAKKKDKQKQRKNKPKKKMNSEDKLKEIPQHKSDTEEKEKVKWNNRKWNKDPKGDSKTRLVTSVVVENLPIKIMCSYKKLLSEHFGKLGTIAGIGVAEAYPTEDLKPVFTTTVYFQEENAATKALDEDNTAFQGNRIRVHRPRPSSQTTLVVRAYHLTDQALSSLFYSAGRIRAIRKLIKGKNSMSTAFVEFDGPESVERALKMAEDAKINGKKMYVSKYQVREKEKFARSKNNSDNDSDSSTD